MQTRTRFRMTDSATIHKQVLRVPAAIIEHLVQQAREDAAFGIRWLHYADLAAMDSSLHADGERLLGMFVRMDDDGMVVDIGMRKRLH
ncbi:MULTISPECIES: hypothetical protein [Silvimonas]|uniref:hypothetical protein n=1 Tax=Silvimonas TaxID=300264 RepID=UPI0024B37DBE|nr:MULTISPECIES: hypothetical protein [Silvimonas]MDR3426518.1 hypothetical protein [Silvimonas sp.]